MMTSNTDIWATPQSFFDDLNREFSFETDVCALPENAKCKKYFTPEDDGLSKDWHGVCWMNPPYGREISKWVEKAYTSSRRGAIVVGLLPGRTDAAWFHDWVHNKAEIRFLRGRIKFGGAKWSAPFPSIVAIWRREVEVCND